MSIHRIDYKYVRIQGRDLIANTMQGRGIFSLCVQMLEDKVMDQEDEDLYREIDAWFAEVLPFPPQCNAQERVVCFFKTENDNEMLNMIRPALWLLDRYNVPYYLIYTNDPGEIVYEDEWQVVVKAPQPVVIDTKAHGSAEDLGI